MGNHEKLGVLGYIYQKNALAFINLSVFSLSDREKVKKKGDFSVDRRV